MRIKPNGRGARHLPDVKCKFASATLTAAMASEEAL